MHTGQLSDEVLAARVARGDQSAFETLYDRHASIVLGLTVRITGDRAAAEDIVQETFWKAWERADSYQPERGSFTTWLFRIARNLAIDAYRRRSARPPAADTESVLENVTDPNINVPEQAVSNVMAQQVQAALNFLPHEQRQVIEMAYFQGMTRQEIAAATGEPIGTIHTRARLGLQKLREALKRTGFEPL